MRSEINSEFLESRFVSAKYSVFDILNDTTRHKLSTHELSKFLPFKAFSRFLKFEISEVDIKI